MENDVFRKAESFPAPPPSEPTDSQPFSPGEPHTVPPSNNFSPGGWPNVVSSGRHSMATPGDVVEPTESSVVERPSAERIKPPEMDEVRVPLSSDSSNVAYRASAQLGDMQRFRWLISVVLFLLAVRYFVPWFAEEIQYAISRGKLRAEYEFAGQYLRQRSSSPLSYTGQHVAKRIAPSVVHISVTLPADSEQAEPTWFTFPFSRQRPRWAGQGSGVIVDTEGYVLTNYHVVKEATEISVRLSDGRRVPARLVNRDELTDLAILKIDADGIIPAEWGDSENIEIGAQVWAVGSPFGLEQSLTTGILSAKHRGGIAGTPHQDFLQTDAPVNPGNSGGPLVDERGKVIGINTAILGESFQGVSFAIPSHVAREVFERLKRDGKVRRGWLGIQMNQVSEELAAQLQLDRPYGVLVVAVVNDPDGCPAERAGIRAGDVIVAWNNQTVEDPAGLSRLVARSEVGSKAQVRLRRGTQWIDVAVIVGEHPSSR